MYTNSEVKQLIEENVHSKRDREILFARLIDGLTYSAIAEQFCLSDKQIRNIVQKFTRKFHI